MLFDLNSKARFEILSSLSISQDPFCYYFHSLNVLPPMLLFVQKCGRSLLFMECKFW